MGGMSCEEWFARLRRSISGERSRRFVGELPPARLDRRARPHLVTMEGFHRECDLAVARIATRRARGTTTEPDRRGDDG